MDFGGNYTIFRGFFPFSSLPYQEFFRVFHVKPRGFTRCGFPVPRWVAGGFCGWVLVLLEPHGHNEILCGLVSW